MMNKTYGLIGYPLTHSFSKKYFTEKFKKEGIENVNYELFEIKSIDQLPGILEKHKPLGLNVTIPYKEQVLQFVQHYDTSAEQVGVANVLKIKDGMVTAFNSDYYGFMESLIAWKKNLPTKALILGSGGASKAVIAVLNHLKIAYTVVSRNPIHSNEIDYITLKNEVNIFRNSPLIINCTPLGMYPNLSTCPDLPYELLTSDHLLYDLVYNPEVTEFMKRGSEHGAKVKNGLEMLILQAEKSWEIWNQTE